MNAPREALRQQTLLAALWRGDGDSAGTVDVRAPAVLASSGGAEAALAAYRANAAAMAERALAAAYPTVAALVGEETLVALARTLWRDHPPRRGDLGEWGAELPALIAATPSLADAEPYLADSARLDWSVHRAQRAADARDDVAPLEALASADPAQVTLALAPGAALVASTWPVVAVWRVHQRAADDPLRFADTRAAFAAQRAETAFVWRESQGFAVQVAALDAADAAFVQALLGCASLAAALDAAERDFAFDRWLTHALASQQLAGVLHLSSSREPSP